MAHWRKVRDRDLGPLASAAALFLIILQCAIAGRSVSVQVDWLGFVWEINCPQCC